jgi:hypothetical protein
MYECTNDNLEKKSIGNKTIAIFNLYIQTVVAPC